MLLDNILKHNFLLGATHLDNFPEDLRSVVHPHWGTFPPQHPLVVDLFGVIFILLWIISFLGNGCVMYIFLSTKSIRTPVCTIGRITVNDLILKYKAELGSLGLITFQHNGLVNKEHQ